MASPAQCLANAEQLGAWRLLGVAIGHDAEGAKVFPTLLRYQGRVSRELKRAKEAYEQLVFFIASRNTKSKPTSTPRPKNESQPPPAEPHAPAQTPRNAPCPCGSGVKFKRCCGGDAPAVLCAA